MSGLIKTIGSIFNPVLNFFEQVWNNIVFVFTFIWDLVEGLYYGFNTLITYSWNVIQQIIGVPFFSENSSVVAGLTQFLGLTYSGLFWGLVLCIIFLICLRFIRSLFPFFRK